MEDLDVAIFETFLNSHDMDDREWFVPDWPELFDEWATGPMAVRGAHDCPDATRREAGRCFQALAEAEPATAEAVMAARDVRDGFMAMMLDGEPPGALDGMVRGLSVQLGVGVGGGVTARPAEGGPRGAAALAMLAAHRLVVSGAWPRLRLCKNEACHWAFLDRSRNGSRVWCSMGTCGARAKARAYRERQRAG
ncbi:MAG: CGNR zinc finger domain-containing protein [Dehalococcoidia bacterium]|nr:CGNR zinc finger domain-containing protein [Dehalococcoidia bacterium]